MKKMIAGVLVCALAAAFVLTACGGSQGNTQQQTTAPAGSSAVVPSGSGSEAAPLLGGWTAAEPGKENLSDEEKKIFETALEGLTGANYTPVAVLATQVVSGTNYAYLCSKTLVTPGQESGWCVVTIYNDLEGKASVSDIKDIDLADIKIVENVDTAEQTGAWAVKEQEVALADEAAKAAFEKAKEGYTGVELKSIALLGTQVVAGTNYKVLCCGTTVTQDPITSLYVADVYEDLEGKAEFTSVELFDLTSYIAQ